MIYKEEHRALINTVRDFAINEIHPFIEEWEKEGMFPAHSVFKKLGSIDLLGITKNSKSGGMGLDYSYGLAFAEGLGHAWDLGIITAIGVHTDMATPSIDRFGSDELKKEFLEPSIKGEYVAALALSEVGAGSDLAAIKTSARKDGDDYIINGGKMWITNSPDASILVVYAKTDMEAGPKGITAFVIEKNMAGFSVGKKLDKLGMRGSNTAELIFDDCEVPFENVLGEEGKGVNVLMSGLDYERVVLAAGPLGIMAAAMDVVVPYVHEREQFGQPVGSFQLMQGKLADMYTEMNACRAYVYAVAAACDRGETTRKDSAGCILYAAEKATKIALEAIQCLGGNGYVNDYPTGRLLRDAKLYEIGAGTSEIRRMLIGRELFAETA